MKSLESYSRLVSVQNLHSSRSKSKSPGSNRSYGSPNASPRLSQKFLGPHDCTPTPSPSREYQMHHFKLGNLLVVVWNLCGNAPEEGWRLDRPKRCEYNNYDENGIPNNKNSEKLNLL